MSYLELHQRRIERTQEIIDRVRNNKYIKAEPTVKQWAFLVDERREVMFGGAAGGGKGHSLSTPVLTSRGWITWGELAEGDYVFDHEGNSTLVEEKFPTRHIDCYRITFDNGASFVVDEEHLWNVLTEKDAQRYMRAHPKWKADRRAKRPSRSKGADSKSPWLTDGVAAASNAARAEAARVNEIESNIWDFTRTVTTLELIELMQTERRNLRIPVGGALQTTGKWELDVDPYLYGYWLGDGVVSSGGLCCGDQDIEEVRRIAGQEWRQSSKGMWFTRSYVVKPDSEKAIPYWAYTAPYEDRLALFQGIMDTDGWCDEDGSCGLAMAREDLLRDIWKLAHTLGLNPSAVRYQATTSQDPNFSGHSWRFVFRTNVPVFRLQRKLNRQKPIPKRGGECNSIISIEQVKSVPTQCIRVSNPRSLYRVGYEQIVTHNSIALLMAALMYVDEPSYRALLLRRTFQDLSLPGALMDIADQWLMDTDAVRKKGGVEWWFPSGAKLSFGYLANEQHKYRYQGTEWHFVGFDEASQFLSTQYTYLFSRVRAGIDGNPVPWRIRAASNPGGVSHQFLKERFIDERSPDVLRDRGFVPARIVDNPHLDQASYLGMLSELDPVTRAQLEHGDWEIEPAGNFFLPSMAVVSEHNSAVKWRHSRVLRCRAWDLAATETGDYAVGVLLARNTRDRKWCVEDVVRVRAEPAQIEQLLYSVGKKDGPGIPQIVEREIGAAGKLAMRDIKYRLFQGLPVFEALPSGNKLTRARLAASIVAAGDLELRPGKWNNEFLSELIGFPGGNHDDQVDALSHATHWLSKQGGRDRGPIPIVESQEAVASKPKKLQTSRLRIVRNSFD